MKLRKTTQPKKPRKPTKKISKKPKKIKILCYDRKQDPTKSRKETITDRALKGLVTGKNTLPKYKIPESKLKAALAALNEEDKKKTKTDNWACRCHLPLHADGGAEGREIENDSFNRILSECRKSIIEGNFEHLSLILSFAKPLNRGMDCFIFPVLFKYAALTLECLKDSDSLEFFYRNLLSCHTEEEIQRCRQTLFKIN